MPSMPTPAQVFAAQRRLSGQLVATPLIGGIDFPGQARGMDLRVKPEMLQPGGSIWFRGMQNFLLCHLGASFGLCVEGPWRRVLPAIVAAAQHRLAVEAFLSPGAALTLPSLLRQVAPEARVSSGDAAAAAGFASKNGYVLMPGNEDASVSAGLATVALELHEQMPTDCAHVFVAAEFAAALQSGFAALERKCAVHPVTADGVTTGLQQDFQRLHGLHLDGGDLGVVAAAAAGAATLRGPVVAVLGG